MSLEGSEKFHTTRWTRVLAAKGDGSASRDALSELCEVYYAPVHAFIRRSVQDVPAETARDLTHEFFAGLLETPRLDSLERGRGRFRSYLLGAVKHFLADHRDRAHAAKRGGGETPLSIDTRDDEDEASPGIQLSEPPLDDAFYDRQWALAVLSRALGRLEAEQDESDKSKAFTQLKPWLNGDPDGSTRAETAAALGISEDSLKVVIHRLRKRFRSLIRAEILQTVDDPDEVAAELDYLVRALGQS